MACVVGSGKVDRIASQQSTPYTQIVQWFCASCSEDTCPDGSEAGSKKWHELLMTTGSPSPCRG
eukprot:CAMPEP_0174291394 /NCGR_PEP_ID=MMETSP0809-20121228/31922_1 /TAXON_ID=73025 ORGANISM="Eutreptiella gymnastica-like, Strain CCMP1594" /NCGR_SAMPLE_ID=MMETSP0809 /ASSEMBLY_ACC=CAM_ASM_000658 /LENGTH=63 /DNA_ID=CAMNT_0015390679 /DNA_START=186 /DNA_END=380 /DNA_ORIENTATION=+